MFSHFAALGFLSSDLPDLAIKLCSVATGVCQPYVLSCMIVAKLLLYIQSIKHYVTLLGEEVTSGNIEIDLKWGFIPVPSQTVKLCDALKCPLEPGTQTLSIVQQIPSEAPSVSYTKSTLLANGRGKRSSVTVFKRKRKK